MIRALLAFTALLVIAGPAQAQTWPAHSIRLVVPNPPGGPIDLVARVVASRMGPLLGQEMYVDNRAGAGQILGTGIVANAAPDGYTLGLIGPAHVTNPALRKDLLPYDSDDFTPIERLVKFPLMLVVGGQTPATSVAEVIALAKERGDRFKFASSGVGTSPHLAAELLKSSAGLQMLHVPFKGTPDATLSVMRGEIDMYFDSPALLSNLAQYKDRLKPLALTSPDRSSLAPHLPTIAETIPGFAVESFIGMVGPANLPPEIVETLSRHLAAVLAMPEVAQQLAQMQYEPAPMSQSEFSAYLDQESTKWTTLIEANDIRIE